MANAGSLANIPDYRLLEQSNLVENMSGMAEANITLNTALTIALAAHMSSRYDGSPAWVYSIAATGGIPNYQKSFGITLSTGAANNDYSGVAADKPYYFRPLQYASMFPNDIKFILEFYGVLNGNALTHEKFKFFIGMAYANILAAPFVGIFEDKANVIKRFGISSNNSVDNHAVGVAADGVNVTNTASFIIDGAHLHHYKMIYYLGSKIDFFYDSVLKGTINTTLPETGNPQPAQNFMPVFSIGRITATNVAFMHRMKCYFER